MAMSPLEERRFSRSSQGTSSSIALRQSCATKDQQSAASKLLRLYMYLSESHPLTTPKTEHSGWLISEVCICAMQLGLLARYSPMDRLGFSAEAA